MRTRGLSALATHHDLIPWPWHKWQDTYNVVGWEILEKFPA